LKRLIKKLIKYNKDESLRKTIFQKRNKAKIKRSKQEHEKKKAELEEKKISQ